MAPFTHRRRRIVAAVIFAAVLAGGCDDEPPEEVEAQPVEVVEENDGQGAAVVPEVDESDESDEDDEPDLLEQLPSRFSSSQSTSARNGFVSIRVDPPESIRERLEEQIEPLAYEPEKWGEPYDQLTELEVLTPEGVATVPISEARSAGRKDGGHDYFLRTEPVDELEERNVPMTFVAVPGVFSPDATLMSPESEALDEERARGVWVRFIDALGDRSLELLEGRIGDASPDKIDGLGEYVRAWELDVADGFDKMVTVNVYSEDAQIDCFSAGFVVDEEGVHYELFDGGRSLFHCVEPEVFADRNGDGRWGMVYTYGELPHPYAEKIVEFDEQGRPSTHRLRSWD